MSTTEQELRQEAIRRRLSGERRGVICQDLGRSPRWSDKWWVAFRHDPHTGFHDHSRAPRTVASVTSPQLEQMVISLRHHFEAAPHGLIGARVIRNQLHEWHITPLPSEATIQRILARQGLTHPWGAATATAYYPWLACPERNVVHTTDIITRHLYGGTEIQNFPTLDLFTHAATLNQYSDKTSATTCHHLLQTWASLGLPWIQQLDNEGAFCGGYTHRRVFGRVVRLCLLCGIEPFFTPPYEPKRNHQIETFHSLWCQAFWSRQTFTSLAHVHRAARGFLRWYHHHYRPPCLQGKTPAQMCHAHPSLRLTPDLHRQLSDFLTVRLPLTAGRIHFMRKVDSAGYVEVLNERWRVGPHWSGAYVRATINTAQPSLIFWHKADETANWRALKTRIFSLPESIHDLLPQFKRNHARGRDYLPS